MPACRLRRDAGRGREFSGRQRPAVHQRIQHVGPAGIADQRADLREPALIEHDCHSEFRTDFTRILSGDATVSAVYRPVRPNPFAASGFGYRFGAAVDPLTISTGSSTTRSARAAGAAIASSSSRAAWLPMLRWAMRTVVSGGDSMST